MLGFAERNRCHILIRALSLSTSGMEALRIMERELQSVQVVGLGQACVDYVGRVPAYPVEDSKIELEGLFTSCGGPAATALVTLVRLGVPTSFLSSISD